MLDNQCPLCGSSKCYKVVDNVTKTTAYHCETFICSATFSGEIENIEDYTKKRQLYNLAFEFIQKNYSVSNHWKFYYDPDHITSKDDEMDIINLAGIPYPRTLVEKADRSLMNLSRRVSDYNDSFKGDHVFCRAIFAENYGEETRAGFFSVLVELGYLKQKDNQFYTISAKGWERIDELSRKDNAIKQGFIAMRFSDETKSIYEALKTAISRSGYRPLRIDEKEHNNQIVPEIFYEIDQSKFLIMDVTIPNYGAYYEAGYALGKGKPVIICCRKTEFEGKEKPHFDIQQKSTIIWESEDDLINRLIRRIQATVK